MARTGRPKKEIDKQQFEKLCEYQCSLEEICGWFEVTAKTMERWCRETYGKDMTFSKVFAQKRGKGKIALRRFQFKLAERNPTLAIWLGKQYLGQRDNPETGITDNGMLADLIEGLKDD